LRCYCSHGVEREGNGPSRVRHAVIGRETAQHDTLLILWPRKDYAVFLNHLKAHPAEIGGRADEAGEFVSEVRAGMEARLGHFPSNPAALMFRCHGNRPVEKRRGAANQDRPDATDRDQLAPQQANARDLWQRIGILPHTFCGFRKVARSERRIEEAFNGAAIAVGNFTVKDDHGARLVRFSQQHK
tara:strand:+ start:20225 stop:20782 length:558 start_codon:yes stop_codon:yes gene_type:complete